MKEKGGRGHEPIPHRGKSRLRDAIPLPQGWQGKNCLPLGDCVVTKRQPHGKMGDACYESALAHSPCCTKRRGNRIGKRGKKLKNGRFSREEIPHSAHPVASLRLLLRSAKAPRRGVQHPRCRR